MNAVFIDSRPAEVEAIVAREQSDDTDCSIELRLSAAMLLHELQQCGVSVEMDTLARFAEDDANTCIGREGYLGIAKAVLARSTRHTNVESLWAWTSTEKVRIEGEFITFTGSAISI